MSAEIIQFAARPALAPKRGKRKKVLLETLQAELRANALGCIIDGKLYEVEFRDGQPIKHGVRVLYLSPRCGQPKVCKRQVHYDPAWVLQEADSICAAPGKHHRLCAELDAWKALLLKEIKSLRRATGAVRRQQPNNKTPPIDTAEPSV